MSCVSASVSACAPAASIGPLRRCWEGWLIADTGVLLEREGKAWRFGCIDVAGAWLLRSGLLAARFDTRRDALRAMTAAAAITPAPAITSYPPEPLVRVRAGYHRTRDGHLTVRRDRNGSWEICLDGRVAGTQPTLRDAAIKISRLRAAGL